VSGALGELIAASIDMLGGPALEQLVFGTGDPDAVAVAITEWARAELGAAITGAHWYRTSVGAVAGVVLDDGRDVVIKVLPERYPMHFVAAARAVQSHLADRGFPAPAPIGRPALLGRSIAAAEAVLDDPSWAPPGAEAQQRSAAALARLVTLAAELPASVVKPLVPHPLDVVRPGSLYSEPHSPVFDFTIDTAETRAIDALAIAARQARAADDSAPLVAHTDFSARNIRVDADSAVCAVYDWDSLALVTESVGVGQAAVTWNALGAAGEGPSPDPEQVAAYLADYEGARGVATVCSPTACATWTFPAARGRADDRRQRWPCDRLTEHPFVA
jgi:hypothetical protein